SLRQWPRAEPPSALDLDDRQRFRRREGQGHIKAARAGSHAGRPRTHGDLADGVAAAYAGGIALAAVEHRHVGPGEVRDGDAARAWVNEGEERSRANGVGQVLTGASAGVRSAGSCLVDPRNGASAAWVGPAVTAGPTMPPLSYEGLLVGNGEVLD